jgi:hypothetical protein
LADISSLAAYIANSINTPLLASDPCYMQVIDDLPTIVGQTCKELEYTVLSLPPEYEALLILLAKKEVYWRLATSVAADLDLETEFTKIIKTKRFDHYFKLITLAQTEIDKLQQPVKIREVTVRSRDYTMRNHQLAQQQVNIGVTVSGITSSTANLDWLPFDLSLGTFGYYKLLVSTSPIYDPYNDPVLTENDPSVVLNIQLTDMRRLQYRVTGLTTNKLYYVTFVYCGYNINTYSTANFTTL